MRYIFALFIIGSAYLSSHVDAAPSSRSETIHWLKRSPALRYALTQTKEGLALLEEAAPGLPLPAQLEVALQRATEIKFIENRFIYLGLTHFYSPESTRDPSVKLEEQAKKLVSLWTKPLSEIDKTALKHAAHDYLTYFTKEDGSVYWNPLPMDRDVISKQVILQGSIPAEPFNRPWSEWDKWSKKTSNRQVLGAEIISEKLEKESHLHLLETNTAHDRIPFERRVGFHILPDETTAMGRFASGLHKCWNIDLIYCPYYLLTNKANGAYMQSHNALLVPGSFLTQAGADATLQADATTTHEVLHAYLGRELKKEHVTPFHGAIEIIPAEKMVSDFHYANTGMSLEEVATMAMSLRRTAQRLTGATEATPQIMESIIFYSKQGEFAAQYAIESLRAARETLRRQPNLLRFSNETEILNGHPALRITAKMEGVDIRVSVPIQLSPKELQIQKNNPPLFGDIAREKFKKEIQERIELYSELQKSFSSVNDLAYRTSLQSPDEIRNLMQTSFDPRHQTMGPLYQLRTDPCASTQLLPFLLGKK